MTHRAAVLYGHRDIRIEERPTPTIGAGEVLLRVRACTICGSDLHYYDHGMHLPAPMVIGHEFAAEVVAIGQHVQGIAAGARVAVEPGISCDTCEQCQHGHPNLCPHVRFCSSPPVDGAIQEFMAFPAHSLFPLPPELSFVGGAMLEPLCIAVKSLDFGRLRVGETAAVIGCGGVGLLIIQLLRAAGATEIYATDRLAYRGEAAIRAGATATLDPAEPVRDLLERTGGRGVDVAFEAASSSATPQQAIEMARIGGRMVLVGIQPDDNVVLHTSLLRRKAITISPVRRAAHVYPRALALVRRGLVQLDWLVTHRFPLEQTNAAFAMAADYAGGALRVAVEID
ncbi:MAG TPA: alcohol dehydrogenase catalytic domain-containing protein [Roseiflexaceae bacterium]|nr:alcohol dehydrogenase catalytic domain-containing protein [Roseiflexaceae bacterium]